MTLVGRVQGERDLLELAREPLLARAHPCDQLLGRLLVELQPELAGALDAPLGQLPRLRGGVLAHLAAGALDRLRELLQRLAAHDQHEHGLRRQLGERRLERAELAGLPGARVVDEQVAGAGVEAEAPPSDAGDLLGLALARVEGLEPAGAALLVGAPAHPARQASILASSSPQTR